MCFVAVKKGEDYPAACDQARMILLLAIEFLEDQLADLNQNIAWYKREIATELLYGDVESARHLQDALARVES